MERSRDEVMIELQPVRRVIIALGEHLTNSHHLNVNFPKLSHPDVVDVGTLRRIAKRANIAEWSTDEQVDLKEKVTLAQAFCSDLLDCPGSGALLDKLVEYRDKRDVLRAELPEQVVGPKQTVRAHGLTTDVLTGILNDS